MSVVKETKKYLVDLLWGIIAGGVVVCIHESRFKKSSGRSLPMIHDYKELEQKDSDLNNDGLQPGANIEQANLEGPPSRRCLQ